MSQIVRPRNLTPCLCKALEAETLRSPESKGTSWKGWACRAWTCAGIFSSACAFPSRFQIAQRWTLNGCYSKRSPKVSCCRPMTSVGNFQQGASGFVSRALIPGGPSTRHHAWLRGECWALESLPPVSYPSASRRFCATASAAIRTGSAARWAYRAVVWTCVWPRSLPIIGSP